MIWKSHDLSSIQVMVFKIATRTIKNHTKLSRCWMVFRLKWLAFKIQTIFFCYSDHGVHCITKAIPVIRYPVFGCSLYCCYDCNSQKKRLWWSAWILILKCVQFEICLALECHLNTRLNFVLYWNGLPSNVKSIICNSHSKAQIRILIGPWCC
jgi:hypothetical protein